MLYQKIEHVLCSCSQKQNIRFWRESSKPKGRAKEVFREKCSFRKKLRGLLHEEFQPWAEIPARSPG